MIIKSMARKAPSFRQLIDYMLDIDKADEQYHVYQNLFSRQAAKMEQEYVSNAQRMAKRKNGNYLYHEILSISKTSQLADNQQKQRLRDIAYEYAKRRASSNLVFGALHDDHDHHLHYHLLISANALGDSKKTRLSKAQFDQLKKGMEERVLKHYPELEQRVVINQEAGERRSRKGAERKRRTGKVPQRDALKAKLNTMFNQCDTKAAFFTALNEADLALYVRGKTLGVKHLTTGRNHRLKTLGLLEHFQTLSKRIELDEAAHAQDKASIKQPKLEAVKETSTERQNTDQEETGTSKQDDTQAKPTVEADSAEKKAAKETESIPSEQMEVDSVAMEQARRKAEIDTIRQQRSDEAEVKERLKRQDKP